MGLRGGNPGFPELSNFYCLPGRAGGSLIGLEGVKMGICHSVYPSRAESDSGSSGPLSRLKNGVNTYDLRQASV